MKLGLLLPPLQVSDRWCKRHLTSVWSWICPGAFGEAAPAFSFALVSPPSSRLQLRSRVHSSGFFQALETFQPFLPTFQAEQTGFVPTDKVR